MIDSRMVRLEYTSGDGPFYSLVQIFPRALHSD